MATRRIQGLIEQQGDGGVFLPWVVKVNQHRVVLLAVSADVRHVAPESLAPLFNERTALLSVTVLRGFLVCASQLLF